VSPTDQQLLDSVAALYAGIDPAPDDLADGVLARLAVEGLETEYELLTLVERVDHASGTRGATEVATDDTATVALEFAGSSYRVLVRISTVDGRRRLDGWVVPGASMRVFLGPQDDPLTDVLRRTGRHTDAGADGRFEFADPVTGQVRLWLLPRHGDGSTDRRGAQVAPFVTPPFLL
jgi:hypothetical protein